MEQQFEKVARVGRLALESNGVGSGRYGKIRRTMPGRVHSEGLRGEHRNRQ